jgi:hypothetical protein
MLWIDAPTNHFGGVDMTSIIQAIVAVAAVAFFVWLLVYNTSSTGNSAQKDSELIDPNDASQLATLIGMTGGDITDVAVARFAIQRFQEQHRRAPNTRDIGTIIGIMRSF